jgi:hypothetical protein
MNFYKTNISFCLSVFLTLIYFYPLLIFSQLDHRYNQYLTLDFQLNPAKCENTKNGIYFYNKSQWIINKFNSKRNFTSISGQYKLNKNFFIGGNINSNKYSSSFFKRIFQLSTSYRIKLNNQSLSLGLGCKYVTLDYNRDVNEFLFDDNDPKFIDNKFKINKFDFSAGIFYRYKSFKLSIASTNLVNFFIENNTFNANEIIFETGIITSDEKLHVSEVSQFNLRLTYSNIPQRIFFIDLYRDYFSSTYYSFGGGVRMYKAAEFNFFNAVFLHLRIKLGKIKSTVIGFSQELNTSMGSENINSSNEFILGFEKEN